MINILLFSVSTYKTTNSIYNIHINKMYKTVGP
jgi:hypothetical protein